MIDDWELIVASFQKEYGIRLSQELDGMKWKEFSMLLNGLGSDTPLGRIVAIRSEDNAEAVKKMTPDQKRLRNDWRKRQAARKSDAEIKAMYADLQSAIVSMVNGKG